MLKDHARSRILILTVIGVSFLRLGGISLAQCPFGDSGVTSADWQRTGTFPPGFFFGVATASHQVEGNDFLSDWAQFELRPDVPEARQAISHHDLTTLSNDLNLARSLGINCYRFSIEWSRVEPAAGTFDVNEIDYYKKVVQLIRTHGMTPMAGLHHFTLPSWLLSPNDPEHLGGWNTTASWSASVTISEFTNYVARMAAELGPTVDHWITFNEPTGQAAAGYVAGVWSPGAGPFEWKSYRNVVNAMIAAHRAAFAILKAVDTFDADGDGRPCLVGAVQNVKPIFPDLSDPDSAQDARDWDYVLHKQFLDALTPVFDTGAFPVPGYAQAGRRPGLNCWDTNFEYTVDLPSTTNGFLDFIGINYYGPAVSYSGNAAGLAGMLAGDASMGNTQMGGLGGSIMQVNTRPGRPANGFSEEFRSGGPWEIYPEGLLCVLRDLFMRYQLPLMVTENGISEIATNGLNSSVSKRPAYIVSHLQMILRAIAEGIPVIGYIHWSLVDNCEWHEGYDTRAKFGLYYVRFNSEVIAPLPGNDAKGLQNYGDVTFKQMEPAFTNFARVETPGAAAYHDICEARGITSDIISKWGSFPSLLGDAVVPSEVVNIGLLGGTSGTQPFDPHFLPGCRILDINLVLTDSGGNPLLQDVNLHQAGRVAFTALQPFNNLRCQIVDSHLGTADGRASVYWERDLPTTALNFRLFYRVKTCPTDVVWVDFNFSCSCAAGTFNAPWPTLWQGRNHVSPGGTIAIKTGTSINNCNDPEYDCFPMPLDTPMTITAYGGPAIIGR
jgi:beta-glucosidase